MADPNKLDEIANEALAKRRVPCMVTFLHPFRIINGPNLKPWSVAIEDINRRSWDYAALHEVVGGLDVGLKPPFHMVVCRDGALGLPPFPELRSDQKAVEFFNRCLAALLIGGVYCEAIATDGLDIGSIIDWKYLRVNGSALAAPNRFHNHVRLKQASPLDAISLASPRTISLAELSSALKVGRSVLDTIPELSGEFLLKGATGIARRDWSSALANLWVVVEQITAHLWALVVLEKVKSSGTISGRVDQMSDARTWTIAARHELLHQIGVIPFETLAHLAKARKARNDLLHKGIHAPSGASNSAFEAASDLLRTAAPDSLIPLLGLDLSKHEISDPFRPDRPTEIKPTHWMEITKLPGESELEQLEAEHRRIRKGREHN